MASLGEPVKRDPASARVLSSKRPASQQYIMTVPVEGRDTNGEGRAIRDNVYTCVYFSRFFFFSYSVVTRIVIYRKTVFEQMVRIFSLFILRVTARLLLCVYSDVCLG